MARHPKPTAAMRTLGLRARDLRGDLVQADIARRGGLDRTFVSAVETGRRHPSLLNVLRLAGALDTDPAVLLDGLAPDEDGTGSARVRRRSP